MRPLIALVVVCLLIGCSRSVLPSERVMLGQSDAELRTLVLNHAPLGTTRQAIEQTFSRSFRRKFRVVQVESAGLISQRDFSVPVVSGDYYLMSHLASVMSGVGLCRMVTVYLLFDSTDRLKDVAIKKWTDSI